MAASVRSTEFNYRTGLGTQDVTIAGAGDCFGYILISSTGRVNGTTRDGANFTVGLTGSSDVAADSECLATRSENAVPTTETQNHIDNRAMVLLAAGGGASVLANHDSFITDGFRLDVVLNQDQGELCKVIAFFGDDINLVSAELTTSATGDTEVTVNVGQQTDLLFALTRNSIGVGDQSNGYFNFGVASKVGGAISQASFTSFDENGLPTSNVRSAASSSRISSLFDTAGSNIDTAWEVTTLDATDIGITTRIDTGTAPASLMLLLSVNFNGAAQFDVGTLTLPTSTGNTPHTGVGFPPEFVLMGMCLNTAYDEEGGTHDAHQANYIGLADGTEEHCNGYNSEDDQGTADTSVKANDDMVSTLDENGAAEHSGTFVSFEPDGWINNYSAAPVAYVGFWLAVGAVASNALPPAYGGTFVAGVLPPAYGVAGGSVLPTAYAPEFL